MPSRVGRTLYGFAVASQLVTLAGTAVIYRALSFSPAGFRRVEKSLVPSPSVWVTE